MSSGFPGGTPDFFSAAGRSSLIPSNIMNNNPFTTNITPHQQQQQQQQHQQFTFRSPLSGILPDPATQIRRQDLIGKRSLAEFQHQQTLFHQTQNQNQIQNHPSLGFYLRNVKPRPSYHHASPISPLSPVDFSHEVPNSLNSGFRIPILHQQLPHPLKSNLTNVSLVRASVQDLEKKNMMTHRLQELEKQLLGDEETEAEAEAVSVVTNSNSEWSETIQNLMGPSPSSTQKPISPSPTTSTSSSSSTSASPPIPCPKQSLIDAAVAITDGKPDVASEILTRLQQVSNSRGSPEQRLAAYMVSALRSRVNPIGHPPLVSELYGKEQAEATQLLYEFSPCFKLGFMAANLAILESAAEERKEKIHVVDFDMGMGKQYVHLLHALAVSKKAASLRITAFADFGGEEKAKAVGEELRAVACKLGVFLSFHCKNFSVSELSRERLDVQPDEALAVNFAFKLYKLPDESVTTENLRDELLRRVKGLSPSVMTVVEQEINGNTAPLTARVRDTCEYYGALIDSLDATVPRDNERRARVEEGLGRKMVNSVACEGRDRVERCEVFGKWRARMGMAGLQPRPMSQLAAESLRSKLNSVTQSGTRGKMGFSVNEQSGGICFGWMGRTLTVASAWR